MEISYKALSGKKLEEDQLPDIKNYIKVFKENNRLRKKEHYKNNLLVNEWYYIEFGESHQELLSLNLQSIKICEIQYIEANYTKNHNHTYHNSILIKKSISVSSNGEGILYQIFDIQTNLPIYHTTIKSYNDKSSEYTFTFYYHSSANLSCVLVANDNIDFCEQYGVSDLDLIPNFEWWEKYSAYYLNAEPAVPVDIVIV